MDSTANPSRSLRVKQALAFTTILLSLLVLRFTIDLVNYVCELLGIAGAVPNEYLDQLAVVPSRPTIGRTLYTLSGSTVNACRRREH